MAQFLYQVRPARIGMLIEATPEESETVGRHFAYLKRLTEQGVVLLAGRTMTADETTFGVVILEVEDEVVARAVMEGDPAVQGGVMTAVLFPFRIALEGMRTRGE
jgi:uncharacterized protein